MKSYSFSSVLIYLGVVVLFGCGPASNQVTLSIKPFVQAQQSFHNLSKDLFLTTTVGVGTCRQTELRLGLNLDPKPEGGDGGTTTDFLTYPIELNSETTNPVTSVADMTGLLSNHSTGSAIQVLVPRGKTVEVGVVGTAYNPIDSNTDGVCDRQTATLDAAENYSIIGHTRVTATTNIDLSLNTWVVPANLVATIVTPTPGTPGSGSFNCPDPNNRDLCSYRDIVKVSSSNPSALKLISVQYFFGKNNANGVTQYLSTPSTSGPFFIPSVFPMIFTYTDGTTTTHFPVNKSGTYTNPPGIPSANLLIEELRQ
jgi:hypothetical protein